MRETLSSVLSEAVAIFARFSPAQQKTMDRTGTEGRSHDIAAGVDPESSDNAREINRSETAPA
jgi:hypothetical protein